MTLVDTPDDADTRRDLVAALPGVGRLASCPHGGAPSPATAGPRGRSVRPATAAACRRARSSGSAARTAPDRPISRRGHRIAANVGDQRSDLRGGFAFRSVKLPNPMYVLP
jgi:hypothetical protein